ncbi:MAG: cation-translocating P-type ATPase [Ardenticatenales bacterium]|nr:cation-translocating P-type ATPase [Ardenticatenales bacterium]
MSTRWHTLPPSTVATRLAVDPAAGLSDAEADRRRSAHGPNALVERAGVSPWRILGTQLKGPMVLVLVVAAVVSIVLGDAADAVAIGAIIVLNTALGFAQEYRAERAMAALKQLAVSVVRVRRDGVVAERPAVELVPGDVVLLEAGAVVPADGRWVEASALRALESILTGESEAVDKGTAALPPGASASGDLISGAPASGAPASDDLAVGDRTNMAYKGTTVTAGRGVMIVVATGMATELGRIADLLQAVPEEATPLQRRLAQLGRGLGAAALLVVAVVGALGLWRGQPPALVLMTALSLAVAAVPEGLPTVVTIALSIGGQRLLARRALVRRLPAVETLGSVTAICSDKTGTLTENRMTVVVLDVAGHRVDLQEGMEDDEPVLVASEREVDHPSIALLLTAAALCNDASLAQSTDTPGELHAVGDPTEGALVVAAARFGLRQEPLVTALPRTAERPFDAERKRMTTVHRVTDFAMLPPAVQDALRFADGSTAPGVAFTKGAVDVVLELADRVWIDGRREPLDEAQHARIAAAHDGLAAGGMRVLGVAVRRMGPDMEIGRPDSASDDVAGATDAATDAASEERLTFVGLCAMIDPPRPAARAAVALCRTAGIRPIMITGDHPLTALQIARQLGIADGAGAGGSTTPVLTGAEVERLSPAELADAAEVTPVFARVSPEHKLRIVEALHARGHIVAMTGDGVNDAPALKRSDIGVAMGITGTDVTKEAADIVLLDDDFATIVRAVEQGRVVYDNIRRFIKYALASNAGEIWVMVLGPLLGMPLPLLPLQILWVNLVTDGLPGLALAVEPAEPDVMTRPPRPPTESVFGRGLATHVLWVGALLGATALAAGWWGWRAGDAAWQTMLFTTLTFSQMGHAMAVRSERVSSFRLGVRSNLALFGAVTLTICAQLAAIYVGPLQAALHTVALSGAELAVCVGVGSVVFWAVEGGKGWQSGWGRSDRAGVA